MSAIPASFDPENPDNLEDIEKQFAVKAVQQMSTYWSLLNAVPPSKLKLTQFDDEIVEEFFKAFPEYNNKEKLAVLNEDELKTKEAKERWRQYIKNFENKIDDYNFGTLLRVNASEEYSEENTIFVVRIQFYAFELARNRFGLNDWVYEKK
ncbi:hypothetical protein CAS74_000354 [Pichia kudriavzevii]|uniref:Protein PBDC1 homolog n=1 Tax=Pichia kudriavzevii TaxID=4909 RepID=A0A099P7Z9_PICKU|nr:hypothetical protein JL09_g368 [Pichia kudriavzevii]ONH75665.1 Protein PBDC1 [Pichia kudriavzevii]OUT23977.1 hypothetical protein CAS74_000354 [Pichia kudriavzevii]